MDLHDWKVSINMGYNSGKTCSNIPQAAIWDNPVPVKNTTIKNVAI